MPSVNGSVASRINSRTEARQTGFAIGPAQEAFTPMDVADRSSSATAARFNHNSVSTRSGVPARLPETEDVLKPLISRAAAKLQAKSSQQVPISRTPQRVYLASQTAKSQNVAAQILFEQAQLEYQCNAFASAETSTWAALVKAAEAVDLGRSRVTGTQSTSAQDDLHAGRRALIEVRDFVGPYASSGSETIIRLVRSHETDVVRNTLPRRQVGAREPIDSSFRLTANEVIDRYLDFARSRLGSLAADSLIAAQSMDLLAAISLGRADKAKLPGPTAICLRRAAVQGQSNNPDLVAKLGRHLADVGLIDEARWALSHSLQLAYNPTVAAKLASLPGTSSIPTSQPTTPSSGNPHYGSSVLATTLPRNVGTKPVPEVTPMSPMQFASISRSVMQNGRPDAAVGMSNSNLVQSSERGRSGAGMTTNAMSSRNSAQPNRTPFAVASYSTNRQVTEPVSQHSRSAGNSVSRQDADQSRSGRTASRFLPGLKKWW